MKGNPTVQVPLQSGAYVSFRRISREMDQADHTRLQLTGKESQRFLKTKGIYQASIKCKTGLYSRLFSG